MIITREDFLDQRDPRFGRANPERMQMPFWELMVGGKYWAWWAREKFNAPPVKDHEPIWCFDRYGMSTTKLSDGRIVHIGGEHEDWYDEDFCIYNDVVVLEPDKTITIFGYPKDVFPPTDFHSATLIGERILIIGALGYLDERTPGFTPVYWLDCRSFRIGAFETFGDNPGWIWDHKAKLDAEGGSVIIRGGEVYEKHDKYRQNRKVYSLDIDSGIWKRVRSAAKAE